MKTKPNPSFALDAERLRERRRNPRVTLSCFAFVRPLEPGPEYFESIVLTDNSCRDGLSFKTDNEVCCERMRLLVTYPYSLQACAINRDYIGEVVRREPLPDGRHRVAVRILTTAKLSVPTVSRLRSSNVWNALWQRAASDGKAGKPSDAGSVPRGNRVLVKG